MSSTLCPEDSNAVLLRWSDAPDMPWREMLAKILYGDAFGATICSSRRLTEQTEVQLLRQGRSDSGIVRSCKEEGPEFILTIWLTASSIPLNQDPDRDPGVFAVEDFLTEEAEARILAEIACEHASRRPPPPVQPEGDIAQPQRVEKSDEGLDTTLSLIRLFRLARSKARPARPSGLPAGSGRIPVSLCGLMKFN